MMFLLKTIILIILFTMWYQDQKDRLVYAFLFPLLAIANGYLFFSNSSFEIYGLSVIINSIIVTLFISIIRLYSLLKLNARLFEVIGSGDILLFYTLGLSFSNVSFLVILVAALLFSLLIHFISNGNQKSVPLVGYISVFVGFIYILNWTGIITNIYSV